MSHLYGRAIHNPTYSFVPRHLLEPCPACGAARGSRCRDKRGVVLSRTHQTRAEAVRERLPVRKVHA